MMEKEYLRAMEYSIYRCSGFGVCKGGYKKDISPCPMYMVSAGFEAETPRGLMTLAREILEGRLEYTKEMADMVYRCTACGNCRILCGATDRKTGAVLVDPSAVASAMRADLVENSLIPPAVRDFLKNVYRYGNPYGERAEDRDRWARGLDIAFSGQEYLLYVGCVGSYDERGQKMARALAGLLKEARVEFGILGREELNDGNEVNIVGEKGLFQYLAEENIRRFKSQGVRKIIALSPHAYNTMKNDYPAHGGDFEVFHYTQILRDLVGSGRLLTGAGSEKTVTYHDPCFLGRHNDEYDAPREVIRSIPGIRMVEMERNRTNSLCCGGGGGNFFTDIIGTRPESPARVRVREAVRTGAQILAVACPYCAKMFEDALKTEQLEDKLAVRDISELLLESIREEGEAK
ncbi:MAG: (Fe-S)-binding protein [Deltaproteobacteria bacterium]|nr:(Fe-S)-binding protein [Deltaproteobacteria bacterium]MBW2120220.1 (Fe-S)-binding protein [Deltaproteobacteria bacterium]